MPAPHITHSGSRPSRRATRSWPSSIRTRARRQGLRRPDPVRQRLGQHHRSQACRRPDEADLHRRPRLDLWLLWNAVTGKTRWDSPENEVVISPAHGRQHPVSGTGKSIASRHLAPDRHGGRQQRRGYFGPLLSSPVLMAIEVQGIAIVK